MLTDQILHNCSGDDVQHHCAGDSRQAGKTALYQVTMGVAGQYLTYILQEQDKCSLPCLPPDHSGHHHLLHHPPHGDSLESNY